MVENYRPDVKHRLGIDYEALAQINPRLVYASISGFGQDGPYADRPGFDQIAQGMGGLMSITGVPGQGPMRVGIPVADLTAGLFCALGILVALLERETSGKGQWVETSLLQAQIFMLDFQAARWLIERRGAEAGRQQPSDLDPDRRVQDPRRPHQHRRRRRRRCGSGSARRSARRQLAEASGLRDGAARSKNRDALNAEIETHTVKHTSAEWIDALQRGRRAVRADLHDRPGVRRPQVKHLGIAQRRAQAGAEDASTWSASR